MGQEFDGSGQVADMGLELGPLVREEGYAAVAGPGGEQILDIGQGKPGSLTQLDEAGPHDQFATVDPLAAGRTRWDEHPDVLPMAQDVGGDAQFCGDVTDSACLGDV